LISIKASPPVFSYSFKLGGYVPHAPAKESQMSMLKVIGILSESDKSWENAAQIAVASANDCVRNVRSIWIENFEATVENGKIKKYPINGKISFVLEG
jgi:dodecin